MKKSKQLKVKTQVTAGNNLCNGQFQIWSELLKTLPAARDLKNDLLAAGYLNALKAMGCDAEIQIAFVPA